MPAIKTYKTRTKKIANRAKKFNFKDKRILIPFIAVVVLVGIFIIWRSFAANFSGADPENWTISSTQTVAVRDDANASGGKYIEFLAPVATGGTVTGFPTPNNTGWKPTGVTLTTYSGPSDITVAGTVIDSKDIRQCIRILAPNVTIKRSRIQCAGDYGLQTGDSTVLEDVEITSNTLTNAPGDTSTRVDRGLAIWSGKAQIRRIYIHGTQRGIYFGEGSDGSLLESSYIGDNWNPGDTCCTAHTTALKMEGGVQNVTIRNNTFQVNPNTNATAALVITTESNGPNDSIIIDGNQIISSELYAATFGYDVNKEKPTTRYSIINNVFITDQGAVLYSGYNSNLFSLPLSLGGWESTWKNNRIKGGSYDGAFVTPWNEWLKTATEPKY